jgi:hypothetical protein
MNAPLASPNPSRGLRFRWPLIIVGLLVLHVVGMMSAVFIATHDRSFVVLPDYYKRALQWDERKAQQLASDQLGWKRTLTLGTLGTLDTASKSQPVSIRLSDKEGVDLEDLAVSISAAPELEPAHAQTFTLRHEGRGVYVGTLSVPVFGSWLFDIKASRGEQQFISTAKPWIMN